MRKAEKRRIGEAKQAQNRLESKESGLLAQRQDQKAREKNYQEKLISLDEKETRQARKNGGSKKNKHVSPDVGPIIDTLARQLLTPIGLNGLSRDDTVNAVRGTFKTTLDPELSRSETMAVLAKKENI
jgi:hypothetical protein